MKFIFLLPLFFIAFTGKTQDRETLKVMSYNLLNFPSVSSFRIDTLKSILNYIKPDIFMVCELTSGAGADDILFNALNEDGESAYDMADYVSGPDTQNMLYFNSNKLGLIDQNVIPTVLRDINEYVLYYKSADIATTTDTTFFYVYVCHLKASPGFEEQRNTEITALKTYLNSKPYTENIIVGGDFNFYGSDTEPAWNTLLSEGGIIIKDPMILPGHWHLDNGFAYAHTQSTRTTSFDGGSYGGMDDRFDFIFIGADLRDDSNDALYVNGSYRAIGQDGLHYNKSLIEAPTNTSEPTPIISALYNMSDHLPIYLEISVITEAASIQNQNQLDFEAFYNSENDWIEFLFLNTDAIGKKYTFLIYNLNGQLIESHTKVDSNNVIPTNNLISGAYILKLENYSNYSLKFVKP